MRLPISMLCTAALLTACAEGPPTLPDDLVRRAATCGVATAARIDAVSSKQGTATGIAESGQILHFALLAGVKDGTFSNDAPSAVVEAMPTLEKDIGDAAAETLAGPCKAAFPATGQGSDVKLPTDALDARLGCAALGTWLGKALASKDAEYGDDLSKYRALSLDSEAALVRGLNARGLRDEDAIKTARAKALAQVITAGSPVPVMQACVSKYGRKT